MEINELFSLTFKTAAGCVSIFFIGALLFVLVFSILTLIELWKEKRE